MKDRDRARTRTSLLLSLLIVVFTSGITAQVTECQNATLADVVFLVDSSSSPSDFQEVRSFLRSVVKGLDIGPNRIHIGLHGGGPEQGFLLKDHTDRKSLLAAVEKIPYRKGSVTDVERSKAMDFLLTEHFTEKAGSRLNQRVPQIAVVITDRDSVGSMVAPAQRLRSHGVLVFGIGVGGANRNEKASIANWSPVHFLSIENYQELLGLTDHLLSTLCTTIEAQRQALADRFGDIFFLVDSGIAKGQLSLFKSDLVKLINQLGVSQSTYRVGLAQYGPNTQVEFNLNTYQTKQQTLAAVRGFRLNPQPNQPRNLGAALQYANNHFFTQELGGRAHEGTPQHLVVVSGRKSSDLVSRAVQMFRAMGVTVYGMRAGATQDDIDLLASAQYTFDSPKVLLLKDFFLTEKKESITQECIGANVADVVFIVDESGSIGKKDFQLVRTFLHSVVSSLDISPSKVRVGIVTYSSTPRAQAYLDTFRTKDEILQFINILPYRRGGTSTGAALNFTLENIFTEERGCRKNKEVQQVAVVITDGKSDDDVSKAAIVLRRQARVTIYAVGIGNFVKDELEIMASHPPERHVFTVDSFIKLKPLKQNLQKILCENIRSNAITISARRAGNKEACVQKDEADIYFLMDDSGSIANQDFQDMKDFIINFLNTFRIGPQHVRVGLVKYADDPTSEFDLTVHSDAKALKKAVEGIQHEGGGTETGKALDFMGPYFDRAMVSRGHKVPEYLIVITDGESTDDVKVPAAKLRAQGIIVYAIGVKDSVTAELEDIAGDPKRTVFVHSFDFLKSINDDIITDICTEDACSDVQGDVFFLTDSSEGMSEKDFQTMKDFMKSVIRKTSVGKNKVHVGVMQFSNSHELEFPLNQHYSTDVILKAIDGMKQIKEGTFTGKALKEVSQCFDQTRGGRPDVRQSLILITDNESKDQVKDAAKALRAKGVEIYAIGVGNANTTQLLDISGSSDRVYSGRDFDALKDLESQVALEICKKDCIIDKADIIFLVDSSPNIDLTHYESMRRFIESVVNHTTVGKDQTRFGLISSSDQPLSHFTLKDHDTKREVLAAIQTTKPSQGDTSIGKALESSLQFFKAEHGGRKALKVPQILIVITDREATNPHDLKTPSDALRNSGVVVVSIGVDKADKEQLKIMAGDDTKRVFKVDTFEALETLYHTMSSALCIKPVCEKADLVFLLDQSSSINEDQYKIVKNFTIDLVNSFNISQEAVHVGLARFSDNPLDEFYLNQYFQKEQCASHIRGMEYTGGNTNIGKALRRIKDYFSVPLGSRREIPKNLVIISDGDSHDDVEDDADFLRAQGIEVFAIAVGDVHDLQLLQITGTPERIFTAKNFHDLPYIRQQVVDTMCDDPNPPPPPPTVPPSLLPPIPGNCSIDIAMGFDISRRSGAPGETLISGHPKLEKFLPEITRYVSSVQGLCCVVPEPVQTNIAFRVVGRDGRSRDDFRFEPYSEAVMDKVKALTVTEPSYFNTALLKSFRQKFKDESDANVKVLLIFSDGLDEDVMKLEEESELLRQSGVSALLTVALEAVRDPDQLQMVEFGRGFDYKLPLSIDMQSVGSTVLKQINTVSDKECCNIMCKCSGHEGIHGPPGYFGTKGPPGLKGQQGFPGEEGLSGERGPHGPGGPQGTQGCPGARGQKGGRGLSGNRGDDGEDGLEGVNGEQGVTGRDGGRGARGDPGNPGIPGIRGEEGPKGQRGLRGDPGEPGADDTRPGPKGDPGNPGPPGPHGADGDNGDDGDLGNLGPDGRRGPPGEKGQPGQAGDPGPPGAPGAPGPQGPSGRTGELGPKGVSGFPGPQGEPGPAGDPGPVGRRGANGPKGQPGNPGAKGSPGSPGPRGMPGLDGRDGYGPAGPPGFKGDPGFPGYPGLQGEDGEQGPKGLPGPKGNQGRGGNSGGPGGSGDPGDLGRPGHKGPRGPPGASDLKECQLISYIRQNCDCCQGGSACPAFPTELVLGLDMSEDVTPVAFERQRSAVLSLLEDITVSESNCPTGARVAVVGYSAHTKYLIRFQDYRRKAQLIESVKNIALERTSNQRQLGAAMRFVGHNVFKRIRAGAMMRKVAVFLSNGPSQDVNDVITAVMEYRGLNIVPAVISLKNAPALGRAMEVDDSGRSIFTVLGRDMAADLKKIQNCAICYDPCERSEQCAFIQEPLRPQEVDVDLVLVADSSREMQADEYAGVQQLLGSVVEQLAVSPQPRRAGKQARVAVVQQSGTRATKVEFGLGAYQTSSLMRRHLIHNMTQQGGSSALGRALDFTLKEVLLKAGQPRTRRVLLTVVGSQTAYEDRAKLRYISQKAKCEGVAMFVVTVGERYDRTQVEELASPPVQQHLIHLGHLKADEQDYGQRFFRVFLSALSKGTNTYPPPALKRSCDQLTDPDEAQIFNNLDGQGSAEQGDEFVEVEKTQEVERMQEVERTQEVERAQVAERTGGQTQYGQLEVVNTLTKGDKQSFLSGPNIKDQILIKQSSSASEDICLLRPDAGSCSNYTVMWFYDTNHRKCSRFWYSSCGGNGNRFKTLKGCEELCVMKSQSGGAAGGRAGRPAGGAAAGGAREARAGRGGGGVVTGRRRRLKKNIAVF